MARHIRKGRSQDLKGRKGGVRPAPGNPLNPHRQRALGAKRRKIRERNARDAERAHRAEYWGARAKAAAKA
ncbi:MAG: hypothetical protein ACFB21_04530 [Opitutales bacterium]